MTLSPQEKQSLSDIRMGKAVEFQEDALENFSRGRYRTAVNRAYYSVLNAARSLLILEGLNPETHDGIVTMLSLHFIKKQILPLEIIKIYKILLSRRTDVDYGDFDALVKEEAENSVIIAKKAVTIIDELRISLKKEL